MKQQTEKIYIHNQHNPYYHFSIQRLHIKVKFSCRLYLEYSVNQESAKSKQIRIQQKSKTYQFGEEVKMIVNEKISSFPKSQGELMMQVKLLSSKGLAFTAGIVTIAYSEFKQFGEVFQVRFNKSQDFDVWCQCRKIKNDTGRISSQKMIRNGEYSKAESVSMTDKKNKSGSIDFDRESVKKSQQLASSKGENFIQQGRKSIISLKTSQQKMRNEMQNYDVRNGQKQLLQKIEVLQSELHKNTVLFQKQRDIISMLQLKQAEYNEERLQLKNTIKVMQIDTDQKRQRIRQLQGEKIKLLMNNLQIDREYGTIKQKTLSLLQKSTKQIKLFLNEKLNKIANDFTDKAGNNHRHISSLSKINNRISQSRMARNIEQNNSKVIFSTVRGLINKQGSQDWLEESIGGKEANPSFVLSNTINDMSISDINCKLKEVSLLNSDLFCKNPEGQQRNASNQCQNKMFLDQIIQQIQKIQKMVEVKIGKMCSILIQLIQKSKNTNPKNNQSAQSSLLGYLQQLETGFEKQIGALSQKQRIMSYYEQVIQQLNKNLYEKQNLVVQLQQQLFKLEEEKDQIKGELHEINYAHAIKQEQYLKKIHLLEYGTNPPDYSSSASPTRKPITKRKQHKKVTAHYEQQLIQYKQHLRTMQIQLLHERDQKSKLIHSLHAKEIQLQQALIEKRRLQFSAKLRQRMTSLNESIQLSIEQEVETKPRDNEKYTQESLGAHQNGDKSQGDLRA